MSLFIKTTKIDCLPLLHYILFSNIGNIKGFITSMIDLIFFYKFTFCNSDIAIL